MRQDIRVTQDSRGYAVTTTKDGHKDMQVHCDSAGDAARVAHAIGCVTQINALMKAIDSGTHQGLALVQFLKDVMAHGKTWHEFHRIHRTGSHGGIIQPSV